LPTLKRTPREYAADGRIFCGVELYEGEETVRSIIEVLGDDTIMYQSDYPHDQCAFPKSPDTVLGWSGLSRETMAKLFAGNTERYMRMA
jgi:predicted TIM-barrel fold metal-dependent hydrolase